MNWQPTKADMPYLELIITMTRDCLLGKGTVDRETYVSNLRDIALTLEKHGKQ